MSFGGTTPSAQTISPSQEYSKMLNVFQRQAYPAFQKWAGKQPLLTQATDLSQQNLAALPQYQAALTSGYTTAQQQLPGLADMIRSAYGQATPTSQLTGPLMQTYENQITPILQSGGALTPELSRLATQQAAARNAAAGMATTMPGLFAEALNRDQYRQARYNNALNQAMQLTGQVSGLGQQGLSLAQGAAGSLYGIGQAPFQNALAYATGQQGLGAQTAQQLYGAEMAPIGAWQAAFNPTGQNVA